jgi:hypothetical protein
MKKYFSWDDLRHRWNIENYELLKILPLGLQPYSEFENPISLRGLLNELPDAELTESIKDNWKELPWPINDRIAEHLISRLSSAWFHCDDVRTVENEIGLDKLTRPTLLWLAGHDLLEKWSIDEFTLCKMIVEYGLPAYDAKTMRSVNTGSSSRSELGEMVGGTDLQRIQAMDRLRFKPFEIDEFESDNGDLFKTLPPVEENTDTAIEAEPVHHTDKVKKRVQAKAQELLKGKYKNYHAPHLAQAPEIRAAATENGRTFQLRTRINWINEIIPEDQKLKGRPKNSD